jgi:hypothetical protein
MTSKKKKVVSEIFTHFLSGKVCDSSSCGIWQLLVLWIKIWVNYWSHVNQILGTNSLWGKKRRRFETVVGGHYTSAIVVTIVPKCCSEWLLSCPSPQPVCINHNQVVDFFPHKYIHACQVHQLISLVLAFDKTLKRLQPKVQMESKWTFFKYWVLGEVGDWSLHAWVLSSIKQDKFQGGVGKKPYHMGCWPYSWQKTNNNCVSSLLHHLHHCRSWGPSFSLTLVWGRAEPKNYLKGSFWPTQYTKP